MRPPEKRRPARLPRGTEADSHNSVPRSPLQGGVAPLLPIEECVRATRSHNRLPRLPAHLERVPLWGGDADCRVFSDIRPALTESLPVWGHA